MKRVFIIHGWSGTPDEGWLPWLGKELEKKGCVVSIPAMPETDHPRIETWVDYLAKLVGRPDEDTYFVGHSIGCQTILRYLETIDTKVGGAIFVAGWFDLENLEDDETREIAKPWMENSLSLQKVQQVLPLSTLIISDNDWYGAFEKNKEKFAELGSKIVVMHNAGHITQSDGYYELPEALAEFNLLTKN